MIDSDGTCLQTGSAHSRRAHDRTGRDYTGQVLELMNDLKNKLDTAHDNYHSRSWRDSRDVRQGTGDVCRPDSRECRCIQNIRQSPSPIHQRTDPLDTPYRGGEARSEETSVITGYVPHPSKFPAGCRFEPRCPMAMEKCRKETHRSIDRRKVTRCVAGWRRSEIDG